MGDKQDMTNYRNNYIEALRRELVQTVEQKLTPTALKYGYSSSPLEDKIKWRPIVLILGNYSSGKSTLINELLGCDVQKTGQAPTDDSFTVITYRETDGPVEDRDGMVLLNDPQFPFQRLKQQGQRFAAHFRLKEVHSPLLENLAIIDTPGMLDSVSERDRGYDYQEVVSELASTADLILLLFDPHKAGTIRETYESLRKTLPRSTSEDRLRFVLNRIDECENLNDLLRVYGTLCWNLSQMTGRKDIPHIYMTYSDELRRSQQQPFMDLLQNQRQDIADAIRRAPKHRLDNLASYIEMHGERLDHFLEALVSYGRSRRLFSFKMLLSGLVLSMLVGGFSFWALLASGTISDASPEFVPVIGGLAALATGFLWFSFLQGLVMKRFHMSRLQLADELTRLDSKGRLESWEAVKQGVLEYLKERSGNFSLATVIRDRRQLESAYKRASKEAREALGEWVRLNQ